MSQNQKTILSNKINSNNYDNTIQYIPNSYIMNFPAFPQNISPYPHYGNIPYPSNSPNLNTQNQNINKQNQIILIPAQSPIIQVNQNNSTHPTLLGNALIPMINEKPISASQKYQQIVNKF